MSSKPVAELIEGFVADEADVAVLLRSGPGKKTLMIRWNLATDEFEIGQWLVSWVFDGALSPDGRFFIYHARKRIYDPNASWRRWLPYNVVCRPPFFTALAYWQESSGTERLRWSGAESGRAVRTPLKGSVPEEFRSQLSMETVPNWGFGVQEQPPSRLIGQSALGDLVLYRERSQPDFYALDDDLLETEWADVDHRGRVLLARKGRIYVRDASGERELIDLNPYEFRPLKPPAWARNWP